MFKQVRELIKEKERGLNNHREFKKEMIKILEEKTKIEFLVKEDYRENILIFRGETEEEEYLYFTLSLEDYSLVDVEDQTDDQNYIDTLWEIKEELGL